MAETLWRPEANGTEQRVDPTPSTAVASSADPAQTADTTAEAQQQVAKAPQLHRAFRSDHRWLAESLWKRVSELKRYPSAARLHGWEGKVVVRAVIGVDGHLVEVRIQKSSGYEDLDVAALEAVRLACPVERKQSLDRLEVSFNLPIVYSLSS